ncbi:hypothetical protein K1W54_18450 [Micromonospora sp. CPCC 205371]|nr:hypothetical protein [Micromonospora sp. CPCC 205371]
MDLTQLLDDVARWKLTDRGWRRVDDILLLLDDALGADEREGVRRSMTALVLAGPRRASQGVNEAMDKPPRQPAPARTVDLVNRLLHRLGHADPDPAASGSARRDDDDAT